MDFEMIKKGVRNPLKSLTIAKRLANGYFYKVKYKLLRRDVRIGKNFRVNKKLSIKGPGKVRIGDNVYVDGTSHPVTPWTHHKNAKIFIGNNVFLNGTRFGCKERIEIGDNCILADCRILDTDFHSTDPFRRNDTDAIKSEPVLIGRNVWISLDCVILKGVTVGENSTISAKSVVYCDVPANSICGGNPAVIMRKLTLDKN